MGYVPPPHLPFPLAPLPPRRRPDPNLPNHNHNTIDQSLHAVLMAGRGGGSGGTIHVAASGYPTSNVDSFRGGSGPTGYSGATGYVDEHGKFIPPTDQEYIRKHFAYVEEQKQMHQRLERQRMLELIQPKIPVSTGRSDAPVGGGAVGPAGEAIGSIELKSTLPPEVPTVSAVHEPETHEPSTYTPVQPIVVPVEFVPLKGK